VVGATGFEHPTKTPAKAYISKTRGTKSGTVDADFDVADPISAALPMPPDLGDLAAKLAALPADVRRAILAAVRGGDL
jgi:hypothetical protein